MAYDLFTVIQTWQDVGVFGVLLPFLLIFTISFAILQKSKILGDAHKNLNVIVSAVLGLLFLQNIYLVGLVQTFLPKIGMALLFFIMFLLLMGTFMGDTATTWAGTWKWAALILAAIAVLWASMSDFEGGGVLWWLQDFLDSIGLNLQMLGLLLVVGVVIFLITRPRAP